MPSIRWSLVVTAIVLTSVLTTAACKSPDGDSERGTDPLAETASAPATDADSQPAAPAFDLDAHALSVATSPCRRYTLRLNRAKWTKEAGQRPKVTLEMVCDTGDPNAIVHGSARVTHFVSEAGTEWRGESLGGRAVADPRSGSVTARNLEQYERADSARRIRIECRILRVLDWRTFELASPTFDASVELICPPYHVGLGSERDTLFVTAFCTEDRESFPPEQRDLFRLLGHGWVAASAKLADANGEPLSNWGASGSGGVTTAMYGPLQSSEVGPGPIRYPVTGTLRLPGRYVVEVVPFEFTDVRLVRE